MQDRCFSETSLTRIAAATDFEQARYDTMTGENQLEAIRDAEIIITGWGTCPVSPGMLDAAPALKMMCHSAGSVKHLIDGAAFFERGIRVCSAREALARGVAEFAFGLMLVSMKAAWRFHAATMQGAWDREAVLPHVREPHGAAVGVIGASCVGRAMLRWCRQLDLAALLLCDPYISAEQAAELGAEKTDLDDLMRRSDVVSLHAPNTDECAHMINARNLRLLRDGAIFINTARGRCVDEQALIAELKTGRIWACIDVTDPEPPAPDNALFTLPNCILTPHIAGSIKENCLRQGAQAADQIDAFVSARPVQGELDLALLSQYA